MGLWSYAKGLFAGSKRAENLGRTDYWAVPVSSSGEVVTTETAMRVAAVYTCVKILSRALATMPLNVYRKVGENGREVAKDHPLQKLFHYDRTNPIQTYFEFKQMMQARLCLRGNAYAYIVMGRRGEIKALRPLHPDLVVPREEAGAVVYDYFGKGAKVTFSRDEVFHLKDLSADGITGLSPIDQMMEVIGSAISMDKHGSSSFKNGARFGGILTVPGKLDPKSIENIRASWQKQYAGSDNAGKTGILEQGMDYKPISMSNEQAQWLDSMKFKRSEIFGIFQVPPHMGGDLERATFSNIEQQSIDFVSYTMMPWLTLWESCIQCALFTEEEQKEYFVKFNANAFLRGDGLARAQKLAIERQNGIINANEWRALEEMNPLDDQAGNTYLIPMNMQDASEPPQTQNEPGAQPPRTPAGKQQEPETNVPNVNRTLRPLIEIMARRIATKEHKTVDGRTNMGESGINILIQRNDEMISELVEAVLSAKEEAGQRSWNEAGRHVILSKAKAVYAEQLRSDILKGIEIEARTKRIADDVFSLLGDGNGGQN